MTEIFCNKTDGWSGNINAKLLFMIINRIIIITSDIML